MTAIAGVWRFDGRPDAAASCDRMLGAQELYGPHHVALWSDVDVALGRGLMRVLPEDIHDRQPLIGGGGRYVLVADIRLDNREDIIAALQIPTDRAATLCDAAVLLAAIERWNESWIDRLVGDYAFGIWDMARRELLLARDPLGQRPLHYHRGKRFVAFATMPRGLHGLVEVPRDPDEETVAGFLAFRPHIGSESFFRGIERVEPGHVVTVTVTGVTARQYWNPGRSRIRFSRPEEYIDAARHLLDEAVRCRLRGVRQVGAHLSGGFDSGGVAATAARVLAPANGRVIAFTAAPRKGYRSPAPRNRIIDETPYAAATASMYGNMDHVVVRSNGRTPLDDLDRSFLLFDRPVVNLCNLVWMNNMLDSMRDRNLTVAIRGDLGNFGLSHDGMELLPELIRHGHWLRWWREGRALVTRGGMRWRGVLANTFGAWCPQPLWGCLRKITSASLGDVLGHTAIHPRRLAELHIPSRAKTDRPWKDGAELRVWVLRYMDPGIYNKGVLGGWQIDERDPTADVRLLEFCLGLPTEQFLEDGQRRRLARRVLSDRLPRLVLDETRRGLQAADWHEGLTAARDRIADELDRLGACGLARTAIDLPRLHRLVQNWPAGGWERPEVIAHYRHALMGAISAGHFLRRSSCSKEQLSSKEAQKSSEIA
jgi:asparagine synthase (glutamine-hydrolysing)